MLELRPLDYQSIAVRILLAIFLGGIIGMERGMKNRAAGLRTYILVCLGSCVVMMTNQYVYQVYQVGDPVRMGAQVVNGIGFLGAGTIIVTKRNQIKGLTTAAGLWASACIGLALGVGLYEIAIPGSVGIFLILTLMHELDFWMRQRSKQLDVYIELKEGTSIRNFLEYVRELGFEASNLLLQIDYVEARGVSAFNVTLKTRERRSHDEIMCLLRVMEGLSYAEEL